MAVSESDALLPRLRDRASPATVAGRKSVLILAVGLLMGLGLALAVVGVARSGHPLPQEPPGRSTSASASAGGAGWGRRQPILPLYARRPSTSDEGAAGRADAPAPARSEPAPTGGQARPFAGQSDSAAEAASTGAAKWRVSTFLG